MSRSTGGPCDGTPCLSRSSLFRLVLVLFWSWSWSRLVMARLAFSDHHCLEWSWSCFGLGLSLDLWWHALLVQIIIIYSGLQLTTVIKTDICFVHIFTIYRTEKIIFGWVWWHMDNLVYLPVSHDLILYMLILRVKIVALPLRTTKTTTHRMWSRGDGHNLNNP